MYVSMKLWYTFVKHFSVICKILLKMIKNVSFFFQNIPNCFASCDKKDNVKVKNFIFKTNHENEVKWKS